MVINILFLNLKDSIDIAIKYLRSKYLRLVKIINKIKDKIKNQHIPVEVLLNLYYYFQKVMKEHENDILEAFKDKLELPLE